MTKRGSSVVTAALLASLPLILDLSGRSVGARVATRIQEAYPAESAPAVIEGRPRCLMVGKNCKPTLDGSEPLGGARL